MKSLLKYTSLLTMLFVTLTLTACGEPDFDITLQNGSDVIIETENIQITNQELFEMVATHTIRGANVAILTILDWADYLVLSNLIEIDEDRVTEELEMLQERFDEDELAQLLLAEGLTDLETHITMLRLQVLREQAVQEAIEISEEDILEVYNEWFPETDDVETEIDEDLENDDVETEIDEDLENDDVETEIDEDLENDDVETEIDEDLENDDVETEIDEDLENDDVETEERVQLEDIREEIEEHLREEIMQDVAFHQGVLANIRYEAGLTVHSNYLTARYEDLLVVVDHDVVVNGSSSHGTAVATLGEHTLTIEELFDSVITRFALSGQSPVLRYIDLQILNEYYDVDSDQVRAAISEEKVNRLEWFYPQMEMIGLTTERQIFDHFLFETLVELAFEDNFEPDEAIVQAAYENYVPNRNVNHILVDTYEEAEKLIAQLNEADAEDFAELFSALAMEYSSCGSSHNGGSLGSLTIPSGMAEEFEVAAFALEEGEFTNTPVETQFGYHIIFVDEIEPLLTLEQHGENEMQNLRNNTALFSNFMIGLREQQHIVFHNIQLQAQYEAIVLQVQAALEESDDELENDELENDELENDE